MDLLTQTAPLLLALVLIGPTPRAGREARDFLGSDEARAHGAPKREFPGSSRPSMTVAADIQSLIDQE